jgi:arginine repressor
LQTLPAPASVRIFKNMVSQLNSYRNFIDIKTKEGQALVANAIEKFTKPLVGDERLSLAGSSFQMLKDMILCLGSC